MPTAPDTLALDDGDDPGFVDALRPVIAGAILAAAAAELYWYAELVRGAAWRIGRTANTSATELARQAPT